MSSNNLNVEHKLNEKSVKPTAVRNLVLKYLVERGKAFSVSDLEEAFDTIDKSTLFRTLKTFEQNDLVHTIDDGTGKLKYALCTSSCNSSTDHQHFHFTCQKCGETFCLPKTELPSIELPPNFAILESNLVLKGLCNDCNT
ncbi:MAG: transcriptional repressor [Prolixibacteraceae bacterium]|jgi:Fur family ferric uptake transcriptional regulator|nr:transcriptional repressor [Prolixibacteraceae bacterium]